LDIGQQGFSTGSGGFTSREYTAGLGRSDLVRNQFGLVFSFVGDIRFQSAINSVRMERFLVVFFKKCEP